MNNLVTLKVNNSSVFNHWEDVSITSEMNTLARSFELTVTAKLISDESLGLSKLTYGDMVQVFIGEDLILTGYIDSTPLQYDATSVTATIKGRSRTEDLIECCPAPANQSISDLVTAKSNEWSSAYLNDTSEGVVDAPSTTARSWNNVPLKTIIAQLIAPYSIQLIDQSGDSSLNRTTSHTVQPTETILTALSNLVTSDDLWFMDNEKGNLVIVKKGANTANDILRLGDNVLNASADFDGSDLFQSYDMIGSASGSDSSFGAKCNVSSNYTDDAVNRYRYLCKKNENQSSQAVNSKGIEGEAKYRAAQFNKVTYEVQGWRQSNNQLWRVNDLVYIDDLYLYLDIQEMLIQRCTYTLNSQGMITVLECIPVEGIIKEQSASSSTKTTKTTKKTTTTTSNKWENITPIPKAN